MKKSEIDEKINEKKSDIDEKINEKKAEEPPAKEEKPASPPEEKKADEGEEEGNCPGCDELMGRVSRIEEMLDQLLEEEEEEHSTDAALERAEQPPGSGASPPPDVPEAKAELARMSKELAEIKARFSKMEQAGQKKTMQSGAGNPEESEEVGYVKSLNLV